MTNTRGVLCKRCGKPLRSGWPQLGECSCPPIVPSSARRPELVGRYAQYAVPHEWFYIVKFVEGVKFFWDRHPGHRRWIRHFSPRFVVCGYRTAGDAKRAIRTPHLSQEARIYILDHAGNRVSTESSPKTNARRKKS